MPKIRPRFRRTAMTNEDQYFKLIARANQNINTISIKEHFLLRIKITFPMEIIRKRIHPVVLCACRSMVCSSLTIYNHAVGRVWAGERINYSSRGNYMNGAITSSTVKSSVWQVNLIIGAFSLGSNIMSLNLHSGNKASDFEAVVWWPVIIFWIMRIPTSALHSIFDVLLSYIWDSYTFYKLLELDVRKYFPLMESKCT